MSSLPDGNNIDVAHFYQNLEDLGIPGKEYIRTKILSSADPNISLQDHVLQVIEHFQLNNGILIPSLRPMLPLLDLNDVPRLEFHQSAMQELRDRLIKRIEEIASKTPGGEITNSERQEKLKTLLAKSFPLIRLPLIQPVAMACLRNLETVDDKYIELLKEDADLYAKLDVCVKRHIWEQHNSKFGDEVSPLLIKYIREKENIFANVKDPKQTFFLLSPKQRRQNEVLQKLAEMVGKNEILYDTTLQFLRTLYLHTNNPHYCTLRVSLLMELHDANISDITNNDACHRFAWCLDACIREGIFEAKRSKEMLAMLEQAVSKKDDVLSDYAMALADPYAINFVTTTILKILNIMISNEGQPRDHFKLHFLLRLLNLGLHPSNILSQTIRAKEEPVMNVELVTRFIPTMMAYMVDDQVRAVNAKLPPDDRESALAIIEHSGPPSDLFQKFVTEDCLAAVLAIYYAAQAATRKDRQAVIRVLPTLISANEGRCFGDQYMHCLVAGLICLGEEFSHEDLCNVVFNDIFLPALRHGSTAIHLMKLIWHVHQHIPTDRLADLIKSIEGLINIMKEQPQTTLSAEMEQRTISVYQELQEKLKKADETPATSAAKTVTTGSAGATEAIVGSESIRQLMTPAHTPSTPSYIMSPSPSMSPYHYQAYTPSTAPSMSPYPSAYSPHGST